MKKMDNFYIILPSNVDDIYGGNTIGTFKTKLPERVLLPGQWEVALTEISYPKHYYNIETNQTIIVSTFDYTLNYVLDEIIPPGHYEIKNLAIYINRIVRRRLGLVNNVISIKPPELKSRISKITLNTGEVTTSAHGTKKLTLLMTRNLGEVFGYREKEKDAMITIKNDKIEPKSVEAPEKPDSTAGFTSFYVYCDLVKHKIVGNVQVQHLRNVHIERDQDNPLISYNNPQYNPIVLNEFDSIEISIKNDMGNNVKFTSGKCILTLHFRKIL